MDAALHAATLLARQNKAEQARSELLGLISNSKLLEWHGLLKTLSLYVEVEKECRDSVEHVLDRASAVAIKRFGIRLEPADMKPDVRDLISIASKMFGSASRTYSQLMIRGMAAPSKGERDAVIRELRRFAKVEPVGFFRMQARETLRELVRR